MRLSDRPSSRLRSEVGPGESEVVAQHEGKTSDLEAHAAQKTSHATVQAKTSPVTVRHPNGLRLPAQAGAHSRYGTVRFVGGEGLYAAVLIGAAARFATTVADASNMASTRGSLVRFGQHGSIPLSSPSSTRFLVGPGRVPDWLSRLMTGVRPLDVVCTIVAVKKCVRVRTLRTSLCAWCSAARFLRLGSRHVRRAPAPLIRPMVPEGPGTAREARPLRRAARPIRARAARRTAARSARPPPAARSVRRAAARTVRRRHPIARRATAPKLRRTSMTWGWTLLLIRRPDPKPGSRRTATAVLPTAAARPGMPTPVSGGSRRSAIRSPRTRADRSSCLRN